MNSDQDHVFRLIILACVLAVGWYVSRESLGFALLIILVGMAVTYKRPVFGIPVAVAMAILAAIAPWAVLLVIAFAGLVTFATKAPEVASSQVDPAVGMMAADAARDFGSQQL